MGLAVGQEEVKAVKVGNKEVISWYLGEEKIWPVAPDIDVDELKAVLSVITMGYWQDILPWKDDMPWIDKIEF